MGLNAIGAAPGVADAITGVEVDSCTVTAPLFLFNVAEYRNAIVQEYDPASPNDGKRLVLHRWIRGCHNLQFGILELPDHSERSRVRSRLRRRNNRRTTFKRIEFNGFSI